MNTNGTANAGENTDSIPLSPTPSMTSSEYQHEAEGIWVDKILAEQSVYGETKPRVLVKLINLKLHRGTWLFGDAIPDDRPEKTVWEDKKRTFQPGAFKKWNRYNIDQFDSAVAGAESRRKKRTAHTFKRLELAQLCTNNDFEEGLLIEDVSPLGWEHLLDEEPHITTEGKAIPDEDAHSRGSVEPEIVLGDDALKRLRELIISETLSDHEAFLSRHKTSGTENVPTNPSPNEHSPGSASPSSTTSPRTREDVDRTCAPQPTSIKTKLSLYSLSATKRPPR